MPFSIRKVSTKVLGHRYGLILFAFLTAAALTGMATVMFMWVFEWVLEHRLDFSSAGPWCWLAAPLLFLVSVELVRRFAPAADGTGIPQTVFAAQHLSPATQGKLSPLTSPLTLFIKVLSLLLGLWVGASTGREGPSVHVATCVFMLVILAFRRLFGLNFDMRSAVVAGGAAGLAAAFNTPLAGVTFAIEELSVDYFSSIKDFVLMAIIVAAISAKLLTGESAYFGKLLEPPDVPFSAVILIGVAGGLLGGFFSVSIVKGRQWTSALQNKRFGFLVAPSLACGLLLVASAAGERVLGPGNGAAKALLTGDDGRWALYFPFAKMASTLFTYWSGIAGGIFAPALSIGAAIGSTVGHWINAPLGACALIGMAAFLSGTIQAPITSFVIIFEMTGHHKMLLPVMLASLVAFMIARLLGVKHLYQSLAQNYRYLLAPQ